MKYYLAYGSNLNKEQMQWRCPGAKVVGVSVIKNWRLAFKGSKTGSYLTIEPHKGSEIPVAIWAVTERCEGALDRYEGYPIFYYKRDFMVPFADGHRHKCFAYIMDESRRYGMPTAMYYTTCLDGYRDFGMDANILDEALSYTEKMVRRCA